MTEQPVAPTPRPIDRDFLRTIPKTDLHLHLDGSLRLPTLIDLARRHGVKLPSETPEGLLELVFKEQYRDLPDYLHGFAYTSPVLCDPESLEQVAYELGQDCLEEGVCYIEVRFAPQLHVRKDLDIAGVLAAVDKGLDRVRREHEAQPEVRDGSMPPFRYGLIACAMRMFTGGFAPYYKNLIGVLDEWPAKEIYGVASMSLARAVVEARDRHGLDTVVGFDLAGAEAGHPASDHIDAFEFAKYHFMKTTVHAGEAYGPESIFQAITLLNADRIGHGTHLYSVDQVKADSPERYVQQLSEYVADRRITLEVCITSNLQTMPQLRRTENHPFGRMLREKLSVTLCTDNRLVSRTSVTDELAKACEGFDVSPKELRNLIFHGFKRSFFPGTYREKRTYVRQIIDTYDRIAAEHGMPSESTESADQAGS